MTEKEYLRLKTVARAEYERKLASIETVWKMMRGEDAPPPAPERRESVTEPRTHTTTLFGSNGAAVTATRTRTVKQYGGQDTKRAGVREAIRQMPHDAEFTVHE